MINPMLFPATVCLCACAQEYGQLEGGRACKELRVLYEAVCSLLLDILSIMVTKL